MNTARLELVVGECQFRASCLQSPELDKIGPAPLFIPAIIPAARLVVGRGIHLVGQLAGVFGNALSEPSIDPNV